MQVNATATAPFVQIPLEILNAKIGDKAKLLWVELKRLSNKNTHTVYAYMEHMARYLGCTVRHVRNVIRQLIDAKIIEDTGKVNGFGNRIFRFVKEITSSLQAIKRSAAIQDVSSSLDSRWIFSPNESGAGNDKSELMQQAWQKIYDTCRFDNRSLEELKQSKLFQDLAQAEFLNLGG